MQSTRMHPAACCCCAYAQHCSAPLRGAFDICMLLSLLPGADVRLCPSAACQCAAAQTPLPSAPRPAAAAAARVAGKAPRQRPPQGRPQRRRSCNCSRPTRPCSGNPRPVRAPAAMQLLSTSEHVDACTHPLLLARPCACLLLCECATATIALPTSAPADTHAVLCCASCAAVLCCAASGRRGCSALV